MTLRVRLGTGTTQDPIRWEKIEVPDIRLKWAGVWELPSRIRVKWDGVWNDSGYIGPPGPPTKLRVQSWDYNNMVVAWNAPARLTGSDPDAYHLIRRIYPFGAGDEINDQILPLEPRTRNYAVDWLTRYKLWVRSRIHIGGGNYKYSAWCGPLDVKIGRPPPNEVKNQILEAP